MPKDFMFASDDSSAAAQPLSNATPPWLVLVADDEPEIHAVTRLVLARLRFRGRAVQMIGCASAAEAERLLRDTPDIAVLLLDVVMETDDAGLRLVRTIREDIGNTAIRIILRTGQPGQAPEEEVVLDHDIDGYTAKTELTARKLLTTVVAALRSYAAIRALESGRNGLERIVRATDRLFAPRDEAAFAAELLAQMPGVLDAAPHAVLRRGDTVIAATGRYAAGIAGTAGAALPPVATAALARALRTGACVVETGEDGADVAGIALPIRAPDGTDPGDLGDLGDPLVAWIDAGRPLDETNRGLAGLYASRIGMALANLRLTERLREATGTLEQRVAERTRALEETNARLNRLATLDPLTGVWNRRRFLELAGAELARARRYGRQLGLFLLDLDGFKAINDRHGHAAGDAVLRAVVKRTRGALRASDHIARFGGEEFVVLLPETDGDGTAIVAERVRAALADGPVMVEDRAVAVTGSLGIASWRTEEPTIEQTLRRADDALYAAKRAGRNRVERAAG